MHDKFHALVFDISIVQLPIIDETTLQKDKLKDSHEFTLMFCQTSVVFTPAIVG